MGNCVKASTRRQHEEADNREELHQAKKESVPAFVKRSGTTSFERGASLKVKIVLTKEELEWLMFELKVNEGKKLEDVLTEIERGRSAKLVKAYAWKPSLDSIMEISPDQGG